MATGELITVILEMARECEDMDEYEPDEEFINKLRDLATDSQKYRAKKDRKTQRSNFRQILHYVEVKLEVQINVGVKYILPALTLKLFAENTGAFIICWTDSVLKLKLFDICIFIYLLEPITYKLCY